MIYCSNCGTGMADDATFCNECGQAVQSNPPATSAAHANPDQNMPKPGSASQTGKEIQHFLKVSLPGLTKKILFDPLDGTKKILTEIKEPAKIGLYCVLICSFIITFLVYLRIPSEFRREIGFFEYFFKMFMLPVIGAFVITFLSFIIKAINNSKKANFGNEILTGGIVSIGYALFFVLAFLLSYILESSFNSSSRYNSFGNYSRYNSGPPVFPIIIIFSIFIYLLTITSNSFSQSLRSSGIKDGTAFYLSPFLVIVSAYITIRLWIALFAGKYNLNLNDIFNSF